jgi:hypothetical protein
MTFYGMSLRLTSLVCTHARRTRLCLIWVASPVRSQHPSRHVAHPQGCFCHVYKRNTGLLNTGLLKPPSSLSLLERFATCEQFIANSQVTESRRKSATHPTSRCVEQINQSHLGLNKLSCLAHHPLTCTLEEQSGSGHTPKAPCL